MKRPEEMSYGDYREVRKEATLTLRKRLKGILVFKHTASNPFYVRPFDKKDKKKIRKEAQKK